MNPYQEKPTQPQNTIIGGSQDIQIRMNGSKAKVSRGKRVPPISWPSMHHQIGVRVERRHARGTKYAPKKMACFGASVEVSSMHQHLDVGAQEGEKERNQSGKTVTATVTTGAAKAVTVLLETRSYRKTCVDEIQVNKIHGDNSKGTELVVMEDIYHAKRGKVK